MSRYLTFTINSPLIRSRITSAIETGCRPRRVHWLYSLKMSVFFVKLSRWMQTKQVQISRQIF
jgi:hypothetical protein